MIISKNPNKINLGSFPSRIVPLANTIDDIVLYVKREDEADKYGCGNKVRKLEYALYAALQQGYSDVIIDGFPQSNSCMAVSQYASSVGLQAHVIVKGSLPLHFNGNYATIFINGANIIHLRDSSDTQLNNTRENLCKEISREQNRRAMVLFTGVTTPIATWGAIELAQELAQQELAQKIDFDSIVLPVGTGGTLIGLEIGKYLLKKKWDIWGVVIDDYDNLYYKMQLEKIITFMSRHFKIPDSSENINLNLYRSPTHKGYGLFSQKDVEEILQLKKSCNIYFDTTYVYKALKGISGLVKNGKIKKGSTVLLIHTGGTNEVFAPPYVFANSTGSTI